ncbi:MAG: XVIPCD domain-containing protein [Pseudoxanthomonas sp.]
MPELDIHASAREVVDLLECNQNRRAIDRLDALREGQPLVVQEALDRYIATGAREQLTALAAPGALAARDAGVAGPVLERLRGATAAPRFPAEAETQYLSQAQLHDVYGSVLESRGTHAARDSLQRNGERVILGMRNETNSLYNRGQGSYDDRLVLIWKDNQGIRRAREFHQFNAEPSAQYDHHAGNDGNRRYADGAGIAPRSARSPGYEDVLRRKIEGEDVNGDGVRDLGRLAEGTTEMVATTHPRYRGGRPVGTDFSMRPSEEAVAAGAGRVQRDTNADGWFTAADVNGVQDLNNSFKLHPGARDNTDSAGCGTFKNDYDVFVVEATRNPQQNRWQYVLTSVDPMQQVHHRRGLQNEGQPEPGQAPRPMPVGPPRNPADPAHPDHILHRQIDVRVEALGPAFNEHREQLSMSLLAEAKTRGLVRVDYLFPNQATTTLKSGERLFLVQGAPNDPAAVRTIVDAETAIHTPVATSMSRIEQFNHSTSNNLAIGPVRGASNETPSIRLG